MVADRLPLRWYCGYDLHEPLPDHSNPTRTRERYGLAVNSGFLPYEISEIIRSSLIRLVRLGGSFPKFVVLRYSLPEARFVRGSPRDGVYGEVDVAEVPGKRRVSYGMVVLVDGKRVWRTFSDIDTGEGALPYRRILSGEDYIEHIARSALVSSAGIGSRGPISGGTGHLFDTRELLEHAVGWIERSFPSGARQIPRKPNGRRNSGPRSTPG